MKDLLFLVHRIPYPPNKGDKIRSWNILAHLAERYRVHVGCFIDDPHDWQFTHRIEAIAASAHFVNLNRRSATLKSLTSLLTGAPQTCGFYDSRDMRDWVRRTADANALERVFVYSSSMAQYLPDTVSDTCRTVIDFVDIDSDKWRQYAERKSWPMNQVYRREARTLFAYEKKMAAVADASVFVSEDEAALFRSMAPDLGARVHGIANGVDCEFFDPAAVGVSPYDSAAPRLVFTGAMDYWANVDAVTWFADEIFCGIRTQVPDTEFWIVGANPTPDVVRLGARDGIHITGRVEDVRPYIRHADVSVAPLRVARGIQNKVLEAMALEMAIVASPEAMEGINAEEGAEYVLADGAEAYIARTSALLTSDNRAEMGRAARRRVVDHYGWSSSLQKFESLLEADPTDGKLRADSRD